MFCAPAEAAVCVAVHTQLGLHAGDRNGVLKGLGPDRDLQRILPLCHQVLQGGLAYVLPLGGDRARQIPAAGGQHAEVVGRVYTCRIGHMFAEGALRQQVLEEGWQLDVAPQPADGIKARRNAVQPEGLLLRRFGGAEGFGQYRLGAKGLAGIGLIDCEADDGLGILGCKLKQHAHPSAMQLDDEDGNVHQWEV